MPTLRNNICSYYDKGFGRGYSSTALLTISILVVMTGLAWASPLGKNKIDINSASAEVLETLPGIGEARAAAIVRGRPYVSKADLLRRKILSPAEYRAIRDLVIARH
jgi:DNA uptake protein ComE-like DNA-binding protein